MTAAARKPVSTASPHRRTMIAKVHVAKTQLRLADDDYRAVMVRIAGRDSAAKCTDDELEQILKEFARLGFTAKARTGTPRPANHPTARKARALWISLHQLGAVRDPSERALESFAKRQLGVDRLQWANQSLAYRLIEALKVMGERAGWSQDLAGIAPNATLRVLKLRLVDRLLEMLKADGLVPQAWDVTTAAYRLGGVEVAPIASLWSLSDMDRLAALFATKRTAPAGVTGETA